MRFSSRAVEAVCILVVLAIIAFATGNSVTDWCSTFAVFLCFLHAQLAFELSEGTQRSETTTNNMQQQRLKQLYVLKETMWVATFLAIGNYPLLAGAIVFMSYPLWRGRLELCIQLKPKLRQEILAN